MSDHLYPLAVQRALDTLPPAAQIAALAQLPFARGLDDQLTVVADAWLRCAIGTDAVAASRWIGSRRRREALDMRCAGRAADVDSSLLLGFGELPLVGHDPLAVLLADEAEQIYRATLRVAGIDVDAAPATVGTVAALATSDAARRSHRSARSVQTRMRDLTRAELGGQCSLPGIPAAAEVYRARSLGDVA